MPTTMLLSRRLSALMILLAFALSACGPSTTPTPTVDVNAIYTQAAATIVVELTQTAQALPTATPVPPTETPAPSPTSQPVETQPVATVIPTIPPVATAAGWPTPTTDAAAAFGCYNATLLADVSVPYGANFSPGDKFTKTWRVRNTGTCDWNRGFLLVYVSGDTFGASSQSIGVKVLAGEVAEISLPMVAPNLTGTVSSVWQLATDIGKPFGNYLGVTITLPSAVAEPTSTGCHNAALISQTIANGTGFMPGETFTQTWTVKNTGTCEWNSDFKITFVGGDLLGSDTTKILTRVKPGGSADISLKMVAPTGVGQVTSAWQLATDSGTLFGQIFSFAITLK